MLNSSYVHGGYIACLTVMLVVGETLLLNTPVIFVVGLLHDNAPVKFMVDVTAHQTLQLC